MCRAAILRPVRWVRPTTARSPSRCTTRHAWATPLWRCACTCRSPGSASHSGCRRCMCQPKRRWQRPKVRSRWACWTWYAQKACRTRRWWPMRATASGSTFDMGWKSAGKPMWSVSLVKKRSLPSLLVGRCDLKRLSAVVRRPAGTSRLRRQLLSSSSGWQSSWSARRSAGDRAPKVRCTPSLPGCACGQRTAGRRDAPPTIIVRPARAGEILVTLDNQKRELNPDMLVIADTASNGDAGGGG